MLSRLTWVDREGSDGILALEAGVTGVGLAPVDTSASGQSLRQVAMMAGLGLGVPIVNRAAALDSQSRSQSRFGGGAVALPRSARPKPTRVLVLLDRLAGILTQRGWRSA
ncbi:MAG TPA: hypothetical protein VM925_00720 [Labilithrix sp.]|nr:hypothetical protein [Labilithrix sp.]